MNAHDVTFDAIGGGRLALRDFAGKAILVVNTASECGYTPQYRSLQSVSDRYCKKGLIVLGIPSNDFGAQEPGDEAAIRAFCEKTHKVTFPMTKKESVIGENAHAFYRWIVDEAGEDAAPRWNFHKYLISRQGALIGTWPSRIEPDDPAIVAAIEAALNG